MAKWKREALHWFDADGQMFEGLFQTAKSQSVNIGAKSFSATIAEDQVKNGLSSKEAAWLSATMYGAGAETTSAVMAWFMLAMVLYPEVQAAAQKELDELVGRSQLPSLADFERLPYLRAVVMETLRWGPVAPLGLPHASVEDDWYNGYFIPKGTLCIANVWVINRDTEVYGKDANLFNPNHFLDNNIQFSTSIQDTSVEEHVVFGFGRRICVGRHLATRSLFIQMASILWACNIRAECASPPSADDIVNSGLVVRPAPFKCIVTSRFPDCLGIVENSKELLGYQVSSPSSS